MWYIIFSSAGFLLKKWDELTSVSPTCEGHNGYSNSMKTFPSRFKFHSTLYTTPTTIVHIFSVSSSLCSQSNPEIEWLSLLFNSSDETSRTKAISLRYYFSFYQFFFFFHPPQISIYIHISLYIHPLNKHQFQHENKLFLFKVFPREYIKIFHYLYFLNEIQRVMHFIYIYTYVYTVYICMYEYYKGEER